VYYDGILNGSAGYDSKWFKANPGIKTAFEIALSGKLISQSQPIKSSHQVQSSTASVGKSRVVATMFGAAGLVLILVLAFWRRKISTQ
jgi:hypothetical protein